MSTYRPLDGDALLKRLDLRAIRGRVQPHAPMSKITWFRTGGPAELLYQPADEEDLACFLAQLPADIAVTVVGIGSNLLVRDGGMTGVVIRLPVKGFGAVRIVSPDMLWAGAAVPDKHLAAAALQAGIAGFHFYHGIPGGLGGALRMNGGANGVETAERVVEVHCLDRSGRRLTLSRQDMHYSYRHAGAPDDLIFVSALLKGEKGDPAMIRQAMDAVQHHRETVQPIREKTGGSTFRNPDALSAWQVIDAAGCRGLTVGGAQMSPMHCNFMINTGQATAYDLESLGELVRQRVFAHCGIRLHWEIRRIGQFLPGKVVLPAEHRRD